MAYSIETVLRQIPEVSCVEGDEANLYVGSSDGQLLHYVIHKDDPESDSLDYTYLLASRQEAAARKPPRAIILLKHVSLAAVLANEQLSFYALPEFAPASDLRTIKDVQGVIQNSNVSERIDAEGFACLTLFTKKKIRQIRVSQRIVKLTKEVEYPDCLTAAQRGSVVCAATKKTYDLIDLDKKAKIPLIPVVQGEVDPIGTQYDSFLPHIASVTPNEFLLASGSPESSNAMGMFITLAGEITRGTLMYDAYPLAVLAEGALVISLLSNHTIEVHDIQSQERLQVISAEHVTSLHRSSHEIPVVSTAHLDLVMIKSNQTAAERPENIEKSQLMDLNEARTRSDILSSLVLIQSTGIGALTLQTRLLMIDKKLEQGELHEALLAAEQLAQDTPSGFAERLFHELAYINQKAGLLFFGKMLFDDAVDNFKKGDIDPRILISFFPEFESRSDMAKIYAGLKHTIAAIPTVDQIIHDQLSESVDDKATLEELETIVKSNATELLRRYLTLFREKRGFASMMDGNDAQSLFRVIEVTLLRILLSMDRDEATPKLVAFFKEETEAIEEIRDILKEHAQWIYLVQFEARHQNHEGVLSIWRKLVSGEFSDQQYDGSGVSKVKDYLLNFGDDDLFWDHGIWVLRQQPSLGIDMFLHAIDAGLVSFGARDLLDSFRTASADRGIFIRLLEHLVLLHSTVDLEMTNELILIYTTDLLHAAEDETIVSFLAKSIHEYHNLVLPKDPYLTFVSASGNVDSSKSIQEFVKLRTKLVDMLQGPEDYDAQAVLDLVLQKKDFLLAERILLYGRLHKHAESLNLMVHDLQDFDSAEVFCYHGGISLSQIQIANDKLETVEMRRKLFPLLFSEYLKLENYSLSFMQGANLLNRWGNYMDIVEILEQVPEHWSVELISSFLLSALSKLAGDKRDAQIKRSLARASLQRQTSKKFVLLDA